MRFFTCYILILIVLSSCSSNNTNNYFVTNRVIDYNFPMQDFFKGRDYIGKTDYDLNGNVKTIVFYKILPKINKNVNKNKSYEISYDRKGRFLEKKIFHNGSFFFNGKVKKKLSINYKSFEKELIEKDFSKDSSVFLYRNSYNNKGNLIKTESARSAKIYVYDIEGRIIREESFSRNSIGSDSTTKSCILYKYVNDNHKVKTRKSNNQFDIPFEEHYYYNKEGKLDSIQLNTYRDTIFSKYDHKQNLLYYKKTIRGKSYEEKKFVYNEEGLLVSEAIFKKGVNLRNVTYEYDKYKNPLSTRQKLFNYLKVS